MIEHLARHYQCSPDVLTEEQIRQYILARQKKLKPNSMRPVVASLKFFYDITVHQDWSSLRTLRIPKTFIIPAVLIPETAWQVIEATKVFHFQVLFRTLYTCGLRNMEVRHLTVRDVDADRRLLHLRITKGHHQRSVPLPQATLDALREYWTTHRHPKWLFPGRADLQHIALAENPISEHSVQRAFAKVVRTLELNQGGVTPHTLRHSYATALLEAGINLKVLQSYLGHKMLQSTEIYLHLTRDSDSHARAAVDRLMNGPVNEESQLPLIPPKPKGGDAGAE